MFTETTKRKMVVVKPDVYVRLSKMGAVGMTYNGVIKSLLDRAEAKQT
jgi:hypothetical protein